MNKSKVDTKNKQTKPSPNINKWKEPEEEIYLVY